MKPAVRFRLVALAISFLLPFFLALAVPRVDLLIYDIFVEDYDDLAGFCREFLGPPPSLHSALVLLGERESRDLDKATQEKLRQEPWGVKQDLAVGRKLIDGGASAVVFDRNYTAGEREQVLSSGLKGAILPVGETPALAPADLSVQSGAQQLPWLFPADTDGVTRRFYLAVREPGSGQLIPTLPLVLCADFVGVPLSGIRFTDHTVWLGKTGFPVQADAVGLTCLAQFYNPQSRSVLETSEGNESFQHEELAYPVKLQELLTSPNHLLFGMARGRYCFVGNFQYAREGVVNTLRGDYRDFQFLAVALDTLIQGRALRSIRGFPLWCVWLALDALLVWWMLGQGTALRLVCRGLIAMVVLAAGEFCLIRWGFYVAFSGPALGLCILATLAGLRLWVSAVHLLHRFGGGAAVAAAEWGLERDAFSDIDERTATILFINLPDYFKSLERLNSPNLFARRKEFSVLVSRVAHGLGGIIHDYQADALMIGFGTDVLRRDPEHAVRAVEAARRLQESFREHAGLWLDALDPAQLRLFAGVCTGEVAVGFVGAARYKKAPAAIGDTTNVAARLLGAARKLDVDILVSKTTFLECQQWVEAEELPPVPLKGKTHPVEIFRVRAVKWEADVNA